MTHQDLYVPLKPAELDETREWSQRDDNEIPSMDEGSTINGEPIVYGMRENPKTGLPEIPVIGRRRKWRPEDLEAFRFLNSRHRLMLDLHLKGKSYKKIGDAVGISHTAARKTILQIKNRLRVYRWTFRNADAIRAETR